ncbi:MAG: ester cyclase [Beijerinckiaceae bacterium]|nr:ester cyclase [Beijerinckiaceae bacterium]
MKAYKMILAAAAIALLPLSTGARADDKATVQTFYDFLSNAGSATHAKKFKSSISGDWKSIGDYSGKSKSAGAFAGQLGFFAKLIPNLKWKVEEMIQAGDRVIVRGRAAGTPKGPLFGVNGKGKSFEIMSIDIHTIKDKKIVKTYHIEDWAGALRQLKGK